jgi:hypothetical protein
MNKQNVLLLTFFLLFYVLCSSAYAQKKADGETQKLGNGTVKTWLMVDDDKKPLSMGVTFSEEALNGLPKTGDPGGFPLAIFPDYTTFEYVLKIPDAANLPFKNVGLNWNPGGHPPDCYGNPHFDVHFYMMDESLRSTITCMGDDTLKIYKQPSSEFIPQDYMSAPMTGEAKMGCHWFDPNSSEFHHGFTKTMIYGFYDGNMVFVEPMITLAYLKSKPNSSEPVKQPKTFQKSGYYPTSYSVKYDENSKEYSVSMNDFVLK